MAHMVKKHWVKRRRAKRRRDANTDFDVTPVDHDDVRNDASTTKQNVKGAMKSTPSIKKKPSASKATINARIQAMTQQGIVIDADAEVAGEPVYEKRDRQKAEEWQKVKKTLPPHIPHLFDNPGEQESSTRAHQTKVINNLFTKLKNGR